MGFTLDGFLGRACKSPNLLQDVVAAIEKQGSIQAGCCFASRGLCLCRRALPRHCVSHTTFPKQPPTARGPTPQYVSGFEVSMIVILEEERH